MCDHRTSDAFLSALTISQTIDEPIDRILHRVAILRSGGFAFIPSLFCSFVFINAFEWIITFGLTGHFHIPSW
jgi:hypothetical protein